MADQRVHPDIQLHKEYTSQTNNEGVGMDFGNRGEVDKVLEVSADQEQDGGRDAFGQNQLLTKPVDNLPQPTGSAISLSDMDLSEGMEENRNEQTVARNVGR